MKALRTVASIIVLLAALGVPTAAQDRPPAREVGAQECADVDGDGVVGFYDFAIVAGSMGLHPGQSGYDARADIDSSGQIDQGDIDLLKAQYGQAADCAVTR